MTRQHNSWKQRIGGLLAATVLAIGLSGSSVATAQGISTIVPQPGPSKVSGNTTTPPTKSPRRLPKEEIVERLKSSTCLIRVPGVSRGTGWVVDADRRLVVTNHHVIDENAKEIHVYFPVKRNGEWVNDLKFYYTLVKPAKATIIASSKKHDLALLQLDSLPKGIVALNMAKNSPPQGGQLHSLAGMPLGSQSMWVYTIGHVRQIADRTLFRGFGETRVVEAQMEYNKGNSGGPIVDDYLNVVAVVQSQVVKARNGSQFVNVRNLSVAVDVTSVRSFLSETLPLVSPTNATQFYARGLKHYEVGRYTAAIGDFSSAIRNNPDFAKAYSRRGWAFYRSGDSRTAIGDFDQAVKLDPGNANAHHGRGRCLRSLKRYDEAIAEFTDAIRFEPTNGRHYNQRGITAIRKNDVKSSYDDFVQASKLDENEPAFFANRGYAARLLKNYRDAVNSYQQAIKLRSYYDSYWNGLGLGYLGLEDYENAKKAFFNALNLHKKRTGKFLWVHYNNIGVTLHKMNELKSAYGAFIKAIELNPDNADLYYRRGLVAKDIGRDDLARQDFQKAASLNRSQYGHLIASNSNGNGTNSSGRNTVNRVPVRRVRNTANDRITGVWVCRGRFKGVPMVITAAFTKGGGYAMKIVSTANGNSATQMMSGNYVLDGDRIVIKSAGGKTVSHRYGYKNGQLWIHLKSLGVALYFDRQQP